MARASEKIGKGKRSPKTGQNSLDMYLGKRRRGRPNKIQASWVRGRADNYRYVFGVIWKHIWPGLSTAQTREDVLKSFNGAEIGAYALEFVTLADLILQVVRSPKFPKRKREAQINFLADS